MSDLPQGVQLPRGIPEPAYPAAATKPSDILTHDALQFLATLHRKFNKTRLELLHARVKVQKELDEGKPFTFLSSTSSIRSDPSWSCAPPAPALLDRRVEITGPTDRKMVINALNSGAKTFMADFEDSNAPNWSNMINGQVNMFDAVRRTITFEGNGKKYALNEDSAVLLIRPRGWHLPEPRILVDGEEMSGSIVDFGLYYWHNKEELMKRGKGVFLYLPKMEHHLEARLWKSIFDLSSTLTSHPLDQIRATVLIETIPAAFQMEEILYELKEVSSGLNCGRWDYIFSYIKKLRAHSKYVMPDRTDVTMTVPFMESYVKLLIQTCHKRGANAMGGMSAQIPIKNDEVANQKVLDKVRADKLREVLAGHDGTWVAHPGLVKIALEVFNQHMPTPNQLDLPNSESTISSSDLVSSSVPGKITDQGIRENIAAALAYCAAWISGNGCVPINHLMEDAATAEIARVQLWQWCKYGASTNSGNLITPDHLIPIFTEESTKLSSVPGYSSSSVEIAKNYMVDQLTKEWPSDFLTSDLWEEMEKIERSK